MINVLPNDIILKIFSYLNINSIINLKKYMLLTNYNFRQYIEYIAASRIKLFILVMLYYKSLKKTILNKLSKIFNINYSNINLKMIKYNKFKKSNLCIYYLPSKYNKLCKLCNKNRRYHLFTMNFNQDKNIYINHI